MQGEETGAHTVVPSVWYFLWIIKCQPLKDCTVVNLRLLARDRTQGELGSALTLPFEGRKQGIMEPLGIRGSMV